MPVSNPIDNSQNIIDSREINVRIDYLAFLDDPDLSAEDSELWADEIEELAKLRTLYSELGDNRDAGTLIRESHFEDYAREMADELGYTSDLWPFTCIDWQEAADELRYDYWSVEFDGVTYWTNG